MSNKRFWNDGWCKLTEEKIKCIYSEKYVFCDDCTRHHLIHIQETYYDLNTEE